jgi:curved DNA-binding protein CbpA
MKDYYAILGVDRRATKAEVRDAYVRLAKQHHPDHLKARRTAVAEDYSLFADITEAYHILSDDSERATYDQQLLAYRGGAHDVDLEERRAIAVYHRGLEAMARADYWRAAQSFRAAMRIDHQRSIYRSYYGLALAYARVRLEEAREELEQAIQDEMYEADNYVNMAIFHRLNGSPDEARDLLHEALQWDPQSRRAREELARLEPSSRGRKILRQLFRRGEDGVG